MPADDEYSGFTRFTRSLLTTVFDRPVTFLRESVVEPLSGKQKTIPYYHRRFNRVPTVDECYVDDVICRFEANQQFKRDKLVDDNILRILEKRWEKCSLANRNNQEEVCGPLKKAWKDAEVNWLKRYADLPVYLDVVNAYMKQKHRLVFERRQQEKATAQTESVED